MHAATPAARAAASAAASRPRRPVAIDLALQGGGSHGAFTWGVLDRLLEEPWLDFEGVSGTSAGALNAAVLATGLAGGGSRRRARAQAALRAFWEDVAASGACFGSVPGMALAPVADAAPAAAATMAPGAPAPVAAAGPWAGWPSWFGWPGLPSWPSWSGWPAGPGLPAWPTVAPLPPAWSPGAFMAALTSFASPYQFNPLDINLLRDIVRRHVDIAAVKRGALAVFVNATAVRSGRPRIFDRRDLSHDALLASACLPQLFRAVQIAPPGGGEPEPYWDGGYSGNPALWPLIYETAALDLVLVKIDPLMRAGTPDTPLEIHDRVNEITFNAGLAGEMRAIAFVQKLHTEGRIDTGHYKNLRLHMVADEAAMEALSATSKLDTSRAFLESLHALGRRTAEAWLAGDAQQLGRRSTLDVRRVFLGEPAAPSPAATGDAAKLLVPASSAAKRRGPQPGKPRRRLHP